MWRRSASALALFTALAGCGGGAGEAPAAGKPGSGAPGTAGGERAPVGAGAPAPGDYSGSMATDLKSITASALADAARRTGRDASTLKVVSAEAVTWPDGSLGCPEPGMAYTQALVPGFRIRIQAGAEVLDYHAGRRGQLVLCPPGRSVEPAPGGPT